MAASNMAQRAFRGIDRALSSVRKLARGTPTYADWLAERVRKRRPLVKQRVEFSVLTSVYINTDAALFKLAAQSVFLQATPVHEWIVLAHGPVTPELDAVLSAISSRPGVKVFRLGANLGIMGAMRFCLERSSGKYILPLDADDLLLPDTVSIFCEHISALGTPAFLFSDEDIYIDERPRHPYWRPGWDPVLNLESSYIWHACAIRRDIANDLHLYTNQDAAFCHDWDSVFKIVDGGAPLIHVPEVLYHWRHHTRSTTNNSEAGQAGLESGSIRSVRATLEARIARTGAPHRYDVTDFPIFRGARELYISRREVDPTPMEVVILQRDESVGQQCAEKVAGLGLHITAARRARIAGGDLSDFAAVLGLVTAPFTVVLSESVQVQDRQWYWEALRQFELCPDATVVTGRLIDASGRLEVGCLTFDESFQVVNQYQGRAASDPGHFALALKPLTTALTSSDFFIARTDALQRYCALSAAEAGTPGSLGALVSAAAACYGERIVYSPLVQGETAGGLLDGGVGLASFFSNPGNLLRIQSLIGSRAFGAARFLLEGSSYM